MYIILIAWCFHNLGNIEPFKKILCIGLLILILYIATSITFNISKSEVIYPNAQMIGIVKQTLVWIFAGLNGFIVMPYICREIEALYQENINLKNNLKILKEKLNNLNNIQNNNYENNNCEKNNYENNNYQ